MKAYHVRYDAAFQASTSRPGEPLRRADELFDVFLTADRNLAFQQNLSKVRPGVVVLAIGSTKLHDLRAVANQIATALDTVQPGQPVHVTAPG
jgi:hypothetical protein